MVPLFLSLFFISLIGIMLMIGRRLIILEETGKRHTMFSTEITFESLDLRGIKHITVKKVKQVGFYTLVYILRFTIKGHHFVKQKGKDLFEVAKQKLVKRQADDGEPKEVSKFLKTVSAYKHRLRKIKKQIKEEENIE